VIRKLLLVFCKYCRCHVQAKVDQKQKLDLQVIHFSTRHPPNFSVVGIVEILVVKKFCSEHHTRNYNSVHVQRIEHEALALDQSVNVDQCQDEALPTARGIFRYPFQVIFDANPRWSQGMELGHTLCVCSSPVVGVN